MALFKSDEAIREAMKQEFTPIMSGITEGLTAVKDAVVALNSKFDVLASDYTKLKASVDLKKHQLEDQAEEHASKKATEMLAGMGHAPVPEIQEEGNQPTLLEQFAMLKGQAQREFYNTHKVELMKLCEQ